MSKKKKNTTKKKNIQQNAPAPEKAVKQAAAGTKEITAEEKAEERTAKDITIKEEPAGESGGSFLSELKKAALEAEPQETLYESENTPVSESTADSADEDEYDESDDGWTTTVSAFAPREEPKEEIPRPVSIPERQYDASSESRRAGHYDRNNEISFDISNGRASSGPPVSEEEKRRRAAALDALDRDLNIARSKKLEELEQERMLEQAKKQREQQRLEQAQLKRKRLEDMESRARSGEQRIKEPEEQGGKITRKTDDGVVSHGTSKVRENAASKEYNGNLFSMNAVKFLLVIFVLLCLLYAAAYVYAGRRFERIYDDFTTELTAFNKIVTDESIPYELPANATMTLGQKEAYSLDAASPDTDRDGLEDRFELDFGTDPLKEDTDGDSISDGLEYKAGLDPKKIMTDGATHDSKVIVNTTVSGDKVQVELRDVMKAAQITLAPAQNYTLNGTPGMVGTAYEFSCSVPSPNAVITFTVDSEDAKAKGLSVDQLSVYKYDPEVMMFSIVDSFYSSDKSQVSAKITESGVYALFDTFVAGSQGKTQVFFLFDNSGSMYPEELCKGSEENDVDFKRLDMALNLIDMLGPSVNYGAAEFSGPNSYKQIAAISDDSATVKKKIDDIRNKVPYFTGTQIAEALEHSLDEFGEIGRSDKNYIVLLTDGMPSKMEPEKDKKVIAEAKANNVTIFTIGLGKAINTEYLINYAQSTNGQFFQATNADALENIYDKIRNFMSYNQIVIDDDNGTMGFILGDSGFNIMKNGFGYNNFRSDFAMNGADVGIAGLIKDYYSTGLSSSGAAYTTTDGREIAAYDISGVAAFSDGKLNLKEVKVDILDKYEKYLLMPDKWDFKKISGGLLHYNDSTRKFIEDSGLRIVTAQYDFEKPELSAFDQFIGSITNNNVSPFTQYECVLVDSKRCTGDDLEIMKMFCWYCNLPYAEGRTEISYDFGYEGDKAFEVLNRELTEGIPSIIAFGGNALNAIRLSRDNANSNIYVLDAYDSNSPERVVKIRITRTPLNDWKDSEYQYKAEKNGEVLPLRIFTQN